MPNPLRLITAAASHGLRVSRIELRAGKAWLDRRTAQRRPRRPRTIQFPVNDICNSRCGMCNIWKQKRDHEITPDELRTVLSDKLFRDVTFVGLSGGEPTLRKDLAMIGEVLCESLPKLKAVNIITNAIRTEDVVGRITQLHHIIKLAGKTFTASVSLDGVGEIHDLNRGVPGNFDAAVAVIDELRSRGVPVTIGCTLTPINAHHADDLLAWCEARKLDFVFRLGVEIERVYNAGYNLLNPLSPEMRFHLALFFDKLSRHPRVSPVRRRFNRSLADQLALGSPRAMGCQWQTDGVTLDTRGGISYCSVKSPIVGNALERSAWKIFRGNIHERRRIVANDCSSCKHDLAGRPLPADIARDGLRELVRPFRERARYRKAHRLQHNPYSVLPAPDSTRPATREHPADWRRVLITGWYGSETAGDKAILGEIAHFLRTNAPNCEITVTTIDRKVSEQTRRELRDLHGSRLIDLHTAHKSAGDFDAVILGGGPIQPMAELEHVWNIFRAANKARAARIVFGCGVGRLSTLARCYAQGIFQYTTAGFLRDAVSRQRAIELGGPESLAVGCDPAVRYVRRWLLDHPEVRARTQHTPRIATLVRANTSEYIADLRPGELERCNDLTAMQIAQALEDAADRHDSAVDLLPMCALPIGGDDRLFNRTVAGAFRDATLAHVERGYLTLDQTLRRIASADAAVAMRYHGHLFCLALGVPMLSVDYTGEHGKVAQLIERIDWKRYSQTWAAFSPGLAGELLSQLITKRPRWSSHMLDAADEMVAELERAYFMAFDVRVAPNTPLMRIAA